ncbi:MAG: YIP1 family protein [Acutalibacteraceae bacterium]
MREELKAPFFMLFHPFQFLNRLKQKKTGSVKVALLTVVVYFISEIFVKQFTSLSFAEGGKGDINIFIILLVTALPAVLFAVANWCFCTLMQGEGTLKEIFIAISYSLLPLIIFNIITTLLSYVLSADEVTFFVGLNIVKMVWFYYLIFLSVKTVQQYTFMKTLASIALSIFGIAIIVFLAVLVFSLFQQLYIFVLSIYNEISFRI